MLRGRLWQMPAVLARVVSSSTNVQSVRHCSTSSGRSEGESGVKGSKTGVWDAAGAGAKEAAGAGGGGAGARDAAGSGGGGAGARHSSGAGGAAPAAGGSSVTEGVAGAGAAANPPPGRANTFVRLRSLAKTASYKRRAMEKDPTRRGRISLGTPLSPRMMQVLRPPRQGKESWRREAEEVRSHSHWTEGDEGGPFGDMSLGEWVFPGARGFPEDMDISALRSPEEINELARRMHPSDREWSTEKLEDHALPAPPTPAHRRFISLGEARNVDPVRLAELARQASEYGFAVHFSSPTPGAPAVAHTIGLSVHGGFAYELLLQAVSPQVSEWKAVRRSFGKVVQELRTRAANGCDAHADMLQGLRLIQAVTGETWTLKAMAAGEQGVAQAPLAELYLKAHAEDEAAPGELRLAELLPPARR